MRCQKNKTLILTFSKCFRLFYGLFVLKIGTLKLWTIPIFAKTSKLDESMGAAHFILLLLYHSYILLPYIHMTYIQQYIYTYCRMADSKNRLLFSLCCYMISYRRTNKRESGRADFLDCAKKTRAIFNTKTATMLKKGSENVNIRVSFFWGCFFDIKSLIL